MNENFKTIFFIIGIIVLLSFSFILGRCSRDDELDGILSESKIVQDKILADNKRVREINTELEAGLRELQGELDSKATEDAEYYRQFEQRLADLERNNNLARGLDKDLEELIRIADENAKAEKD